MNEPNNQKKKKRSRALELALFYLSRKSRAQKEIELKLERKGFAKKEISSVVGQLKDWNFLNDLEFAKGFVRQAKLGKPKGVRRIRFELVQKGVGKELIERALEEEKFREDESGLIESALKSYSAKIRHLPRAKQYNRTIAYLLRRGFSYEEAKKAVGKFLN